MCFLVKKTAERPGKKKLGERRKFDEPSSPSGCEIARKKTHRSAQNNNASDQRRAQRKRAESAWLDIVRFEDVNSKTFTSGRASDCWLWLATQLVKSHPSEWVMKMHNRLHMRRLQVERTRGSRLSRGAWLFALAVCDNEMPRSKMVLEENFAVVCLSAKTECCGIF